MYATVHIRAIHREGGTVRQSDEVEAELGRLRALLATPTLPRSEVYCCTVLAEAMEWILGGEEMAPPSGFFEVVAMLHRCGSPHLLAATVPEVQH